MKCKLKGGSLASNYVMKLGNTICIKKGGTRKSKTRKSKTRKSKTRKSKTRKSKTRKSKTRKSKTRKSKMKGGGSDWVSTLYSRGPINNPSTYNEQMFRVFNKNDIFYSTQGKLNKIP
jgi:hypothetical protein